MRKGILSICIFCILCVFVSQLGANETASLWSRVYGRAQNLDDKVMLMQSIVEIDDQDIEPFIAGVLIELNLMREELNSTTERFLHTELSKLVVNKLGLLRSSDSSEAIYDVLKTSNDTYLKAEAILALGRISDPDFADDIAIQLRNLNLNYDTPRQDKDSEVLAYAAVLALERFKQPVGYNPLFFASIGWYGDVSDVKQQAARSMQLILEDPTDVLKDLIRLETEVAVKLAALRAEDVSQASPQRKSEAAAEGLRQGVITEPKNIRDSSTLAVIRVLSMDMLIRNGATASEPIPFLEELLYKQYDINEKLTALSVIETNRTDEAIAALIRFLKVQNERQSSGLVSDDFRVIKSTIKTLGEIGSQLAFEELTMVKVSNWTPAIVREAETALEKIGE